MTAGRKILVCDAALLLGLVVLGVFALCGMRALQRHHETTANEYAELRHIESANAHLAAAAALLQPGRPQTNRATDELRRAIDQIEQLRQMQQQGPSSSAGHEQLEAQAIERSIARLREVVADVSASEFATASLAASARTLSLVQADLRDLTERSESLVETNQRRTSGGVRDTTVALAITFAVIIVGAIAISIAQYRSIVRPLRALRDGVQRIAAGRFDQRLPVRGGHEFVQLADDFNRMAAELDGLYRNLEQQVAAKSRELAQSERLASVGFLAAGVAHEINNPLGIMSGFAELSLKRLKTKSDAGAIQDTQRTLQIIRDEAFRCREITSKLLNLAKGNSSRERTRVSLAAVVHDVVDMIRAHPRYHGQTIVNGIGDDELVVSADPSEMTQVLLNLITNAMDAVEHIAGGEVRISGDSSGDGVELFVEDNGCGMSPDVRDRAFEPFFSARRGDGQARGGVGLGLSLTHAIVESHGGTIRAYSDGPGCGSRFVIHFPRASASRAVEHEAVGA
jgi:signal transduction histidine kinase